MSASPKSGEALLREIDDTRSTTPTLWWLGHAGFAVKFANLLFYVDPHAPPFDPAEVRNADLILCTHTHAGHMDPAALPAMMAASPAAKVVLPKSGADHAHSIGIPYERMTTTDADLRVEFFKDGLYSRVYAVPSAHDQLEWTPIGGYPYLGYLIRFGGITIYHAGDCVPYTDLADRLRPYSVTVAILPICDRGFAVADAAQLAADISARWLIPMHYDAAGINRFITHMLGSRPEQRFKIFERGEMWTIPED